MSKTVKIVGITIAILLIIFLIYLIYKPTEKYFKPVVLGYSNTIYNYTDKKYIDTIISIGLDSLGVENVMVMVYPLSKDLIKDLGPDIELQAHIRENFGFQYFIWVDDLPRNQCIKVLSHELIHLKQYSTSELIYRNDTLTWRGQIYDLSTLKYDEKPWEIDAFSKEKDLYNKIIEEVY